MTSRRVERSPPLEAGERPCSRHDRMAKVFRLDWARSIDGAFDVARVLRHELHSEGLDIARGRCSAPVATALDPTQGHILTMLHGRGTLVADETRLLVAPGVHVFVPSGFRTSLTLAPGAEWIQVSAPSASVRGRRLIVRDEAFLAATPTRDSFLRWVLTPQYLSRRIFLHDDETLLSRAGRPISWFHTTMFDVEGLPPNVEGKPVFRMGYESRTEVNACYDLSGSASVRFFEKAADRGAPAWTSWRPLDRESVYLLDEPLPDRPSGAGSPVTRNRHEVAVSGHVSLHSLFDPAPIGFEQHTPGEYSDYPVVAAPESDRACQAFRAHLRGYDPVTDALSLEVASGRADALQTTEAWMRYERARENQRLRENEVLNWIAKTGIGRQQTLRPWMLRA